MPYRPTYVHRTTYYTDAKQSFERAARVPARVAYPIAAAPDDADDDANDDDVTNPIPMISDIVVVVVVPTGKQTKHAGCRSRRQAERENTREFRHQTPFRLFHVSDINIDQRTRTRTKVDADRRRLRRHGEHWRERRRDALLFAFDDVKRARRLDVAGNI